MAMPWLKQHLWLNGWLKPILDLIIELLKVKKKMLLYLALPSSNEQLALEEVNVKLIIIMIVSFLLSLELKGPRLKPF